MFAALGETLRSELNSGKADAVIAASVEQNPWFTPDYVSYAIKAICSDMLGRDALSAWLSGYDPLQKPAKRVGVIMAGNIPLVGFSDMLAILASGNTCIAKPSSKDSILTNYVAQSIKRIDPSMPLEIVPEIEHPEAMIATGSDNTITIFKAKYGGIPAVFRGSRISVAVFSGSETERELHGLAADIFTYCGLGCRNVSHIFVPENYDIVKLCDVLSGYNMENRKYIGNYLQNKALAELDGKKYFDGGFFTMTESPEISTFISGITYSRYSSPVQVDEWLLANDSRIQCVVAGKSDVRFSHPRKTYFGQAQHPALTDYADGIDVMEFLSYI